MFSLGWIGDGGGGGGLVGGWSRSCMYCECLISVLISSHFFHTNLTLKINFFRVSYHKIVTVVAMVKILCGYCTRIRLSSYSEELAQTKF